MHLLGRTIFSCVQILQFAHRTTSTATELTTSTATAQQSFDSDVLTLARMLASKIYALNAVLLLVGNPGTTVRTPKPA